MSQTSSVVHLFAVRQAKLHQSSESNHAAESSKAQSSRLARIYALPLRSTQVNGPIPPQKSYKWLAKLFVVMAHAAVIYLLITHKPTEKAKIEPAAPMMVSLIAPPAPEPELVPVIEPPKPEVKPVVKPKKVVEKIRPIETPTERLVEATTEQPIVEDAPAAPVAPVVVAETPKAPPVVEKIEEPKIEPPRFGVSYLNNPAPDYPPTSRRLGEEGRVLMKVLVSADGAAEDVQIEKSSGSERLDNAAIQAVKRWRFIPAKKNNQALSAYVIVPVKFSLDS